MTFVIKAKQVHNIYHLIFAQTEEEARAKFQKGDSTKISFEHIQTDNFEVLSKDALVQYDGMSLPVKAVGKVF